MSSRGIRPVSALHVMHVVLSLNAGGLERLVVSLVRAGISLGQQVTVMCVDEPGEFAAHVENLGADLVCLYKPRGFSVGAFLRARSILRVRRPDVIHTHQIGSLFYVGPAARSCGRIHVVHTQHGEYRSTALRRRLLRYAALKTVSHVFCVSQSIRMEMCAVRVLAPSKISVVANGIDFTLLSEQRQSECLREILKIPADAPVIGTVGRLAPVKRQDILLRVFRRVRERIPGCHLLVVGDGPARQELEFLAQCLGIADAVRFVGYQEHVRQFLDEMDVFVLTSESEGMPLAILEAAATNTPVVAPRVGGVVEIIRDGKTGLLCDFADQAAYVQAIETFLHNLPYAQQVARNARRIAYSEHSIQRVAHDYNVKYLRLVQSGHPRLSE